METLWFFLIALMLTVYVVLDGFDLGVGFVMLLRLGTDEERRSALGAIGPVWDANEVWLVAAGGVLVFAFPAVYATALSGFYLPMMFVLWLLILRGISIDFGSHLDHPLWRRFFDATFAVSSTLLALLLGLTLGNMVRGVPLGSSGYFQMALFENFRTGPNPGAIDWYTGLIGIFTVVVLGAHGALYLSWRTEGRLRAKSVRLAAWMCGAAILLLLLTTLATAFVQPVIFERLIARVWAWPLLLIELLGIAVALWQLRRDRAQAAFVGWGLFIAGLLISTAMGLYPDILRSTVGSSWNLTIANAATGETGLRDGLWWWIPAMILATGYFWYLYRSLRNKTAAGQSHY
jgi:cytochrome bd ubiquinol oxidase subunit II